MSPPGSFHAIQTCISRWVGSLTCGSLRSFLPLSTCISGASRMKRAYGRAFKKDLGLYLTKKERGLFCKFNSFCQSLDLYLTRGSSLLLRLSPLPLIVRMLLPPLLHLGISVTPVRGVSTDKVLEVLLFPQLLARSRTSLLTVPHPRIGSKFLPTITTSFRCHLTSPFLIPDP